MAAPSEQHCGSCSNGRGSAPSTDSTREQGHPRIQGVCSSGEGICRLAAPADPISMMTPRERERLLSAYATRASGFDLIAAQRDRRAGSASTPECTALPAPQAPSGVVPSARELDVLALISSGLSNAEIGRRLFIGEETAKSHTRSLMLKLQARNRAHAVALGIQRGLVELVAG